MSHELRPNVPRLDLPLVPEPNMYVQLLGLGCVVQAFVKHHNEWTVSNVHSTSANSVGEDPRAWSILPLRGLGGFMGGGLAGGELAGGGAGTSPEPPRGTKGRGLLFCMAFMQA